MVEVLRSLRVRPEAVLGYSSGEIAAAYAAGALSHHMALKVSYARSRVSEISKTALTKQGAMLAVGLGETEVEKFLSRVSNGTVCVACINSPISTTISGDAAAIMELQEALTNHSIFNRRLKVDTAYHSHHMEAITDIYQQSLEGLESQGPQDDLLFVSSVTATEKTSGFGRSYWKDNLVSKVRFSDALENLCRMQGEKSLSGVTQPKRILIELGPHGALSGPIRQTIKNLQSKHSTFTYSYLPSLVRGHDAEKCVLELTGKLFEQGFPIDTKGNFHKKAIQAPTVLCGLPPYAWDHSTSYWHESRLSREYRLRTHPHHDLLGLRVVGSTPDEPSWRHLVSLDTLPWLAEHVVDKFIIFPGAGYICMAIEAIRQTIEERQKNNAILNFKLKDVVFSKALIIPDSPGKIEVVLSLRPLRLGNSRSTSGWEEFHVRSLSPNGHWSEHCQGCVTVELASPTEDLAALQEEKFLRDAQIQQSMKATAHCSQKQEHSALYQQLQSYGNVYGTNFAVIRELHTSDCQAVGTIVTPNVADCMPSSFMQPHIIHPTTLDALVHINLPLYHRHCVSGSVMPVSMSDIAIAANVANKPGAELIATTTLTPGGPHSATADVLVFQAEQGAVINPVISITGGELRGLGQATVDDKNLDVHRDIAY